MLLLTSTSDIIRVVTGAAADVDVHASWVDNLNGTITPGRTNTPAIVTATTTTVVAAPAIYTQRNLKNLNIRNGHATVTTTILVQHLDGTLFQDLIGVTLLPSEVVMLNDVGNWVHLDSQGGVYAYTGPVNPNLGITGTLAETMPRETCPEVNTAAPTASGTLFMQAIYLRAGQLASNITISSSSTAAVTPTSYFFALYDVNRNLLAQSANQMTTAWAADTIKTLAMTTPYRVPASGLYYIGLLVSAVIIPTTKGGNAKLGGQLASASPIIHGTSNTGLSTTLPNPAAAITAGLVSIYAAVS